MKGQQQRAVIADGSARVHHIDNVAHHFLSPNAPAPPVAARPPCLDVAVAGPGCGRASACVTAGLAVAAAGLAGWGSCVVEDAAVAWSASTYYGGPQAGVGALAPELAADLPDGLHTRALSVPPADAGRWVRWRLLGDVSLDVLSAWEVPCGLPAAARPAAPRWRALVWCVTTHDAAAGDPVRCLSRLVNLLRPARLEFLVVPDAWEQRPGLLRQAVRRAGPGWRNAAHLQEIARVVAAGIPVGVRVFPDGAASAGPAGTALLTELVGAVLVP